MGQLRHKEVRLNIYIYIFILLCINYSCQGQQRQNAEYRSDSIEHQAESCTLCFVGDIMTHGPQIEAAKRDGGRYDFSSSFDKIDTILSSANLTIGNLETTFGGKPYRGYPLFSTPDEFGKKLQEVGFDILTTSNNHSADRGRLGIVRTLDQLQSLSIASVGSYRDKKDREQASPLIYQLGNIRLAIMAYTYSTNGMPVPPPTWVDPIDTCLMRRDILRADSLGADYKIVQIHWGEEYQVQPNARQQELAQWLHEQGVDAIIGSHPHVVQRSEYLYNERTGHRSFVIYSMGNFISNQRKPAATRGGIILTLRLDRAHREQAIVTTPSYQWVFVNKQTRDEDKVYRLLPVDIKGAEIPKVLPDTERSDYQAFCRYYRAITFVK